jgi:predicted nucleic acid-binding protein
MSYLLDTNAVSERFKPRRWLTGELAERFGGRLLLIAAAARVHGLQVVTRDVRHFAAAGVDIISPWHN